MQQQTAQSSAIVGIAERIIFHNADNAYTVLNVTIKDSTLSLEDEINVIGLMPNITEGEEYEFIGQLIEHPKYGEQFKVSTYKKKLPSDYDAVVKYLSSDLFHGVGLKTAQKVIESLGNDVLERIYNNEAVLDEVNIKDTLKTTIYKGIVENRATQDIMIQLNEWGIGPEASVKLYKTYKEETVARIQENPFRIVKDVRGIGFHTADKLAQNMGMSYDHPERIYAGLIHTIDQFCHQEGHTYITSFEWVMLTDELLDLSNDESLYKEHILQLIERQDIFQDEDRYYIPQLYYAERRASKLLRQMIEDEQHVESGFDQSHIEETIGELEDELGIEYSSAQRDVLSNFMDHSIVILSGGPGTGKTTVINGIVNLYLRLTDAPIELSEYDDEEDFPIRLCAPTGRAAKRLNETTGLIASTIHRLIGYGIDSSETDELDTEINAELIIVDEMSMVDTYLFYQLLQCIQPGTKIIFVGDEDQLPSVGPGYVFHDLIQSKCFNHTRLDRVYRQQEGSSIVHLAHQMKNGEHIDIRQKYKDRTFIQCHQDEIADKIDWAVSSGISRGRDKSEFQVLAPIYRGSAGINRLNQVLQNRLNPKDPTLNEIKINDDLLYRVGDKVLQLVNRPNDQVFNGDMGIIQTIDDGVVTVDYQGNSVEYQRKDLIEITLAYACSIHKSQGSEFPIVIMPVVKGYYRMLQKSILYTGITRAKESLLLIGEPEAFNIGLSNNNIVRYTHLSEYIKEQFKAVDVNHREYKEQIEVDHDEDDLHEHQDENTARPFVQQVNQNEFENIHPSIGCEEVSPYDFMQT